LPAIVGIEPGRARGEQAPGGGFILFLLPEEKQDALREDLSDLKELPIAMEPQGSKIIHVSGT
jgi:hypothetical protein